MYHLKGQSADRNTSNHSHDEANDHINSGKDIMMQRASNARQYEDHPNLRLDGDKHAPDHSQPASHRHMKEVNHKVDQGEIEPERKRSVMDQVKHAVNPDSA